MQAKSGVGQKIIVSVLHCIFGKHVVKVVKKENFLLFTQGWVGVRSKQNCFVEDIFDSKTVPKLNVSQKSAIFVSKHCQRNNEPRLLSLKLELSLQLK